MLAIQTPAQLLQKKVFGGPGLAERKIAPGEVSGHGASPLG